MSIMEKLMGQWMEKMKPEEKEKMMETMMSKMMMGGGKGAPMMKMMEDMCGCGKMEKALQELVKLNKEILTELKKR